MRYSSARHVLTALLAALCLGSPVLPVAAEPVSAATAQQRLQLPGSQVWDLRSDGARLLPGAVRLALDPAADAASLASAVSEAGLDLSRPVLIYGEPGDARAQALYQRLSRLASGRVDWLVGGVSEWEMAGYSTVSQPARRLPVPQHLVEAAADGAVLRMAAAALRDTPTLDPAATGQQLASR